MKLSNERMFGLQGKRSVIAIGIQGSQTMILPRTMAVCIIILDCGGMIMGLIEPTEYMLWAADVNFDNTYDKQVTELEEKTIVFEQSLRISNWEEPSDTITATGPEIHPNKKRRMSVRECAIIQTFPDDFIFEGALGSMYKQIGNAVPVDLAFQIGCAIKECILNHKK